MAFVLYLACAGAIAVALARYGRASPAAGAVLVLLPLLVSGDALIRGRVFAPIELSYLTEPLGSMAARVGVTRLTDPLGSDVVAQFLPWHAAVRHALAHHQWPLWDPFELCGTVLAGAVQAAPYHPIQLLSLLLPLATAVTFVATMVFFAAAVAAFLFTRPLVRSEHAALVGGAVWMFSRHLVGFSGTAHALTLATMPLVFAGARAIARRPALRSGYLLFLALVLMVPGGHPETMLHTVALAAAYFAFELFAMPRQSWVRCCGWGFGAGLAALLLNAIIILPLWDVLPQSAEYQFRIGTQSGATQSLTRWRHLAAVELLPMIDGVPGLEDARHREPTRHGWQGSAYAGTLALVLALFSLLYGSGRTRWFFAAVALLALLAGIETPGINAALHHLPLFSIAVNQRMVWAAAFALSVLAAIGADTWLEMEWNRRRRWLFFGVASLCVSALAFAVAPSLIRSGLSADYVRIASMRIILPLFLLTLVARLVRRTDLAFVLLLTLVIAQRGGETEEFRSSAPARAFYPAFAGLERLRAETEPFRVAAQGAMLTPDTGAHYGLEDPRGYQAVTLARFADVIPIWSVPQPVWSNRLDDLHAPFLSAMNVRFAIVDPRRQLPANWGRVALLGGYDIARNEAALPRAFVPALVHEGDTAEQSLRFVRECRDFAAEASLEGGAARTTQANGPGAVRTIRDGQRLRLQATMVREGWVVVSESAWRGWHAREHGTDLPTRIADHTFIAIRVPAGEHDICLLYRPAAFVAGAWISAAAALLLVLASWRWRGLIGFPTRP